MKNGYSSLFRNMTANLLAAIIFFCGALVGFISGFAGWLSAIMFLLCVIFFFIEKNPFVKRACFIVMLLNVVAVVCWLLFVLLFRTKFFVVLNWIVDVIIMLYLVYAGLCALNGKKAEFPIGGKLVDSVCK